MSRKDQMPISYHLGRLFGRLSMRQRLVLTATVGCIAIGWYLQRFQSINFVGLAHCGEYMDASAYKCVGVFKPNASSGISDKDRIHLFIKDGFST